MFFSKRANLIFYLKSYMPSVNLMGTSCTGICLEHQLSIFLLTRRGVHCAVRIVKNVMPFHLITLHQILMAFWYKRNLKVSRMIMVKRILLALRI